MLELEYERRRRFDNCDYFAVHREGKKTRHFIANVLARDEDEALRVAKRQCFSKTKERTYWQVTRIGLKGYAAALSRVSMCGWLLCATALGQNYTGGDGSFGQYDPRSGFYSGRTSNGSYYSGSYDPRSGFYSGYVNGRYYWGYGFQFTP